MDGDFAKLATNDVHKKILAAFIAYRIPKASHSIINDILGRCGRKKLTSAGALNELRDIHMNSASPTPGFRDAHSGSYEENRISARVRDLGPFEHVLEDAKIAKYLDIGCGSGSITAGIGNHLNLSADNIFGADIPNWAGHDHKQESVPGFTFKTIAMESGNAPKYSIDMLSGSCQLISLLMVLHHVRDEVLSLMFREILRILSPNGLVLIREHDSPNEMTDSLINIEHGLFEVAIENLTTGDEFSKSYYGKYRTKREWRSLFSNFGFSHIETTHHSGATRGYYSLFRRGDCAIPPIDTKETPELVKDAQIIGASASIISTARNDADLKKLIIGGHRAISELDAQLSLHD